MNNFQRTISRTSRKYCKIIKNKSKVGVGFYSSKKNSSCANIITGKKFIVQNKFFGFPKESDLKIVEEQLTAPEDGQFLCESVYISVDPYQRAFNQKVGDVMTGSQVARQINEYILPCEYSSSLYSRILESKNSNYPVGKHVVGYYGWKTHHIFDHSLPVLGIPTLIIPESLNQPLSYFLGILGMPGVTANFGFLEICQPKPCETVVITGAAGAVGSLVGQIAKIKGCRAIGVVGSNKKGEWITEDLGFDGYINYKQDNFSKVLKGLAPNGIDCYFDNVGGEISSKILREMNMYGRISVCGAISAYNSTTEEAEATVIQKSMIFKQLKMEGFLVSRWVDRWNEAVTQNAQWLEEGKLKTKETVTKGFENTFKAFTDMLKGVNFGKAIVEL